MLEHAHHQLVGWMACGQRFLPHARCRASCNCTAEQPNIKPFDRHVHARAMQLTGAAIHYYCRQPSAPLCIHTRSPLRISPAGPWYLGNLGGVLGREVGTPCPAERGSGALGHSVVRPAKLASSTNKSTAPPSAASTHFPHANALRRRASPWIGEELSCRGASATGSDSTFLVRRFFDIMPLFVVTAIVALALKASGAPRCRRRAPSCWQDKQCALA